jgi:hypothetical protein
VKSPQEAIAMLKAGEADVMRAVSGRRSMI